VAAERPAAGPTDAALEGAPAAATLSDPALYSRLCHGLTPGAAAERAALLARLAAQHPRELELLRRIAAWTRVLQAAAGQLAAAPDVAAGLSHPRAALALGGGEAPLSASASSADPVALLLRRAAAISVEAACYDVAHAEFASPDDSMLSRTLLA
jgi:hypothetical protein